MDLSIVVVSHHQEHLIKKYLPTFFDVSTSVTFEVLLIDNTCSDSTSDWVRANLPQVRILCNNIQKSYAENVNLGINAMPDGRYFVVCNPDVRILSGLWDESVKFMDNHTDVGIMGPQLLNPDNSIQPSCRRFSTPLTLLTRGLHLDGILQNFGPVRKYLMLDYDHKSVMDVDWVTGALMIIRRTAIAKVGGMDEQYKTAYSEDQDWCCRMWRNGWSVEYVPQAKAIHDHQRTGMRKPWSKMALAQLINAIRMFRKFKWKLSR